MKKTSIESQTDKPTVLVTDDEPGMRMALREVLSRSGWDVVLAESGEQALEELARNPQIDLLMTDYRMTGMSGLDLLREVKQKYPALPTIMMTAFGTVEDAVEAMKQGAGDYLLKPFSFDTVLEVVGKVMQQAQSEDEQPAAGSTGASAPCETAGAPAHRDLIAVSPALQDILEIAREVAEADSTVLLAGQSGTGKEVIAQYIHVHSQRKGPFVAINCAALPEGLLESELFGHEKGAFTGAILARKGRFEQANGGTLLLDEISEMPLALQAKLLRVLQEKEVSPVGATQTLKLDVRIIATTNRDLEKEVEEGRFRQDLFYRLNVIALPVPSLAERPEDILPLAQHFLTKYHRKGRPVQQLGDEVQTYLLSRPWPGNVRELENMIERACLLGRGEVIMLKDLHMGLKAQAPAQPAVGARLVNLDQPITLDEMERRLIMATLEKTGGNRTRTADLLGVSVRTVRNKLSQYGLSEMAVAS